MKPLTASNAFESHKFLYLVSKACFFLHITITKDNLNQFHTKTTRFDIFKFAIFIAFGLHSSFWLLVVPMNINMKHSLLLQMGYIAKSRLQVLLPMVSLVGAFVHRKKFFKIVEKFVKIDGIMVRMKILMNFFELKF
jgi:hypothetical protein